MSSRSANYPVFNGTDAFNLSTISSLFDYASKYESCTREWLSTSSDWFSKNKYSSIAVNIIVYLETLHITDVVPVTSTPCLGLSREFSGEVLAKSPTRVEVSTMLNSYPYAKAPPYTAPASACTFATSDCNLL
jgi:hypothetical protein